MITREEYEKAQEIVWDYEEQLSKECIHPESMIIGEERRYCTKCKTLV